MVPKKLLAAIRKRSHKVFLVSAHINLEGDALGAELAMASLLRSLGKKAVIFNEDKPPAEYDFLPGLKSIRHALEDFRYDAAVIVDCSDLSRTGKIARMIRKDRPILNIDHHISNTWFGDVNWVLPKASCACEMVYLLFKALRMKIKKADAVALYTGILADTGSFRYASTSSLTHEIAADLLKHGLDVYQTHRRLNESMSPETIRAFGKIIETLQVSPDGKIAWVVMRHALIRRQPALADQTDAVIHFARAIKGVEAAFLFKETRPNREVRVNLRSTGRVDVNAIARLFGGGGHRMASGATISGPLKSAVARVIAETQKRLL